MRPKVSAPPPPPPPSAPDDLPLRLELPLMSTGMWARGAVCVSFHSWPHALRVYVCPSSPGLTHACMCAERGVTLL